MVVVVVDSLMGMPFTVYCCGCHDPVDFVEDTTTIDNIEDLLRARGWKKAITADTTPAGHTRCAWICRSCWDSPDRWTCHDPLCESHELGKPQ